MVEAGTATTGLSADMDALATRGSRFNPVGGGGEDRLFWTFVTLSAVVHLLVILLGGLKWLREKPPLSDDWSMDADLVADIDSTPATKSALPKAEIAPAAKAPAELLPQLPKKFAVKEPTKPEDVVPEEKEKQPPPEAKPAAVEKKAEDLHLKTENKDDNQMTQKDILKRAALERLRLEEKTAKTAEAPEKDPLARLAEAYEKNKKATNGFGSAAAKGKIKSYGAILKKAINANWSIPEAYNLKGSTLKAVIAISVSERGDLIDVQVKQPSSDPAFDELAVQTVKVSVPLPRPPQELVGEAILLPFTP